MRRPAKIALALLALAAAGALTWWQQRDVSHYLHGDTRAFAQRFAPPPAADSTGTRFELDQLLALQSARTDAQVAQARADRKTGIQQFYGALGLEAASSPDLPALERVAQYVEDDVRIHVRAVKEHYRRLRPYEIESRLEPCIDDVRGDLSYPSGHSAFGHAMALLLIRMVPERRPQLQMRADEFARQRMVCGVHFPSDLLAGRQAAEWLLDDMTRVPAFRADVVAATRELRTALHLPPLEDPFATPTG